MRMRTLLTLSMAIVIAAGLIVGACFSPALAQDEQSISLKNVIVSVYPEYDDPLELGYPSVLVMFEGEVVTSNLPVPIRFLVPTDAAMYSAGSGPRSQYVGGPPDRKPSEIEGWDEISYELQTKYFVVEYYAPIANQPEKVIKYDFIPLYPVSNLEAVVQEPKRSTNFTVSPQGLVGTDSEGFQVHVYNYNNVNQDAPLHFDISYTKADSRPSTANDDSAGSLNTNIIIVVIVIIVLLVGTFILLSRLRPKSRPATTRAERRRANRAPRRR